MSPGVLDAIRAERATLEARLAILVQLEADAVRYYELAAPPAPAAASPKRARKQPAGARRQTRRGRRPAPANDRAPLLPRTMMGRREPPPATGEHPLYDAIRELDAPTTAELAQHTGLPSSLVSDQGRALVQRGLVQMTGSGAGRTWHVVRRDPQAEVEQLIAACPSGLTREQVAIAIGLSRTEADRQLAALVERRSIVRDDDAYRPASQRAASGRNGRAREEVAP